MSAPAGWVLIEYRHGIIANYWLSTEREHMVQERVKRIGYEMAIAVETHAFTPSRYVLYALTPDHPCPDTPCPHCPCTQTTECCYCDGTRTPLEDS